MREELKSVGIDIGTSTTQLVFSTLKLENQSNPFSVPRVAIVDKTIIYRSDIHFTPLLSDTMIDASAVREIVAKEYRAAGMERNQVQTGAVIITGETARKENAKEVLAALSEFAGDFVVATAGPDLEAILAARGAGVDLRSKERHSRILHYDIGGGTSNLALYEEGELQKSGCLDVGGRLVKIDPQTKKMLYVSPKLEGRFKGIATGQVATEAVLAPLLEEMTLALLEVAGVETPGACSDFYTTAGTKPLHTKAAELSFSGGVADCMFRPPDGVFAYGDMGVLLGRSIIDALHQRKRIPLQGVETIRATVVGAGAHSMEISGSTIFYRDIEFPLKNIPVLRLSAEEEEQDTAEAIQEKLRWYADEEGLSQVALALRGRTAPSYDWVMDLAKSVVKGLEPLMKAGCFPILVLESDLAKVLGQILSSEVRGRLLCVDGISVANGDYIDLGAPVVGGTVLPVVVKTLAFERNKTGA